MIITIKDPMPIKSFECWKAGSEVMISILSIVSNKQPSIDSFVESLYIRCHFCSIHTRILKTFLPRTIRWNTLATNQRFHFVMLLFWHLMRTMLLSELTEISVCSCSVFVTQRLWIHSFTLSILLIFCLFGSVFLLFFCQHKQWTDCFSFEEVESVWSTMVAQHLWQNVSYLHGQRKFCMLKTCFFILRFKKPQINTKQNIVTINGVMCNIFI